MHYYKSTIMQIYGIQIDAPHIYFTYGKTVAYKAENLSIGHLCLFTDHIYTLTLSYRVTNVHRMQNYITGTIITVILTITITVKSQSVIFVLVKTDRHCGCYTLNTSH